MAQLNITLNQEEILQLLSENSEECFKKLLQESLNGVLKAESAEQLQAAPYERTDGRTDSRNGFRERELTTRIGRITLRVPRHRNQPFKTMVFENYSRSEAALVASMAEMVVNGVSTRKVSQVVETLCGASCSKSAVSDLCKDLDSAVKEFREHPLNGNYPFITLDATYFKVRESHRIISKALMIAYATSDEGKREIVGFGVYANESKETWREFLAPLGFGTWQATVTSITGLIAKENIVGTMGILYSGGDASVWQALGNAFTGVSGYSFLVFNLLCAPCFAAIGAIRREMNSAKWTWFAVGYQCCFAYAISLMINQFGSAFCGRANTIGLIFAGIVLIGMIYMLFRKKSDVR